jgi:hypothetical protein
MEAVVAESHVISAMRQKRAYVAGEIIAAERRIGDLRAALVHLDATMRLFAGDDINPEAIVPKLPRPVPAMPVIAPRGDLMRSVLDVLRLAGGALNLPEIASKVALALGVDLQNNHDRQILNERIRNALYRVRDKGGAESFRDSGVIFWRLTD